LTYISNSVPVADSNDSRLVYALHSNVPLDVFDDEGNHTGISTSTSKTEAQIPGTHHTRFGDTSYVFAPASTTVHIIVDGSKNTTGTTTSFTLEADQYSADTLVASSTFQDIPLRQNGKATVTIGGGVAQVLPLAIDVDGDGVVDISLPPKLNDIVQISTTTGSVSTSTEDVATSTRSNVSTSTPEQGSTGGINDSTGSSSNSQATTTSQSTATTSESTGTADSQSSSHSFVSAGNGPVVVQNSSQASVAYHAETVAGDSSPPRTTYAEINPVQEPEVPPDPLISGIQLDTFHESTSPFNADTGNEQLSLLAQAVSAPGTSFLDIHRTQIVAIGSGIGILLLVILFVV